MQQPENTFGLSFPIVLDNGTPAKPGLVDSINSSLRIILFTPLNTRNFLNPFGSILDDLIGAPNGRRAYNAIGAFVVNPVIKWEGRIEVTNVEVKQENEFMVVNLEADIKNIKQKFEFKMVI